MSSLLRSLAHRVIPAHSMSSLSQPSPPKVATNDPPGRAFFRWLATLIHAIDRPLLGLIGERCQRCDAHDVTRVARAADDGEWRTCTLTYLYECHTCGHLWEEHSVVTDLLSPWG